MLLRVLGPSVSLLMPALSVLASTAAVLSAVLSGYIRVCPAVSLLCRRFCPGSPPTCLEILVYLYPEIPSGAPPYKECLKKSTKYSSTAVDCCCEEKNIGSRCHSLLALLEQEHSSAVQVYRGSSEMVISEVRLTTSGKRPAASRGDGATVHEYLRTGPTEMSTKVPISQQTYRIIYSNTLRSTRYCLSVYDISYHTTAV